RRRAPPLPRAARADTPGRARARPPRRPRTRRRPRRRAPRRTPRAPRPRARPPPRPRTPPREAAPAPAPGAGSGAAAHARAGTPPPSAARERAERGDALLEARPLIERLAKERVHERKRRDRLVDRRARPAHVGADLDQVLGVAVGREPGADPVRPRRLLRRHDVDHRPRQA